MAYDPVQAIIALLDTTNADDPKYPKQQAKQAHFKPTMTLQEYVTMNEELRAKIFASQYPDIQDSRTTVTYMIDGLRNNPDTAPNGMQLLAMNPARTKEFMQKYNRITGYKQSLAQQQQKGTQAQQISPKP